MQQTQIQSWDLAYSKGDYKLGDKTDNKIVHPKSWESPSYKATVKFPLTNNVLQ